MGAGAIFYPLTECLANAIAMVTRYAGCKCRLFSGDFTPNFKTNILELVAHEANYDGYTPGGVAVDGVSSPVLCNSPGFLVTLTFPAFRVADNPSATDVVGGFWIESAAGDLRIIGVFPDLIPMQTSGQGFPIITTLVASSG